MNSIEKRGIFTISIDLELAWGYCDIPLSPAMRDAIISERAIIRRLLGLFSEFSISATWAIVGHLLSTDCVWEGETVHPEISRPVIKGSDADWFFQHPKDLNDPIWYGKDIIIEICNGKPKQEIGSHSFAHVPFDEKTSNPEAIFSDIIRSKQLHDDANLPFKIFVFPRNKIGFLKLLAQSGILVYRGKTRRWYDLTPQRFQRPLRLLNNILAITPPTVTPTLDSYGLVNIPDSMLLLSRNGPRRFVPTRNLIRMGIAGLNKAVKNREVFHLWFHPSNFAYQTDSQFEALANILKHAQLLFKRNVMEIITLGEIGRRVRESNELR